MPSPPPPPPPPYRTFQQPPPPPPPPPPYPTFQQPPPPPPPPPTYPTFQQPPPPPPAPYPTFQQPPPPLPPPPPPPPPPPSYNRRQRHFTYLEPPRHMVSVRYELISDPLRFMYPPSIYRNDTISDTERIHWLVAKTTQLETEKKQKETEIHKLMDENMRVNALVDMKEAQLLAMHEQCKVMALSASNI